jgi:putative acetyltransferase
MLVYGQSAVSKNVNLITPSIQIHRNNKFHLNQFIDLNEEWIKQYFYIEDVDIKLASNPQSIIENGGFIYSATHNNEVVGVCALFYESSLVFELARMAVLTSYQKKGIGLQLANFAIGEARSMNARKVILLSNTKLEAAIKLYKHLGFLTVFEGQHPIYKRCNIVMELILNDNHPDI